LLFLPNPFRNYAHLVPLFYLLVSCMCTLQGSCVSSFQPRRHSHAHVSACVNQALYRSTRRNYPSSMKLTCSLRVCFFPVINMPYSPVLFPFVSPIIFVFVPSDIWAIHSRNVPLPPMIQPIRLQRKLLRFLLSYWEIGCACVILTTLKNFNEHLGLLISF